MGTLKNRKEAEDFKKEAQFISTIGGGTQAPKFQSGGGVAAEQPYIPKAQLPEDTLSNRLANAGVAPKQMGMGAVLSQNVLAAHQQLGAEQAALNANAPAMSQADAKKLLGQVGETPTNVPDLAIGTNPLEVGTALAAGLGGGIAGAGAVAAMGAGAGTLIAPGVGTVIGGVAGGLIGGVGGAAVAFFAKISSSERQNVKEANAVFTASKTNIEGIKSNLNRGYISAQQAREQYAEAKMNIYASRNNLKKRTQNLVTDFLGDPGDELIKVNAYIDTIPDLDTEIQIAMLNPNPNYISNYQPENPEQ
jgi:hypothetical protein